MEYTNLELVDRGCFERYYGWCISKAKAARIIGVCRKTVYNMLDDGRLKACENGRVEARSLWHYLRFGRSGR